MCYMTPYMNNIIYIVKISGDPDLIKIGLTTTTTSIRMSGLKSNYKREIELIADFHFPLSTRLYDVERKLHKTVHAYKVDFSTNRHKSREVFSMSCLDTAIAKANEELASEIELDKARINPRISIYGTSVDMVLFKAFAKNRYENKEMWPTYAENYLAEQMSLFASKLMEDDLNQKTKGDLT